MFCIIANIVVLSLNYEGSSKSYDMALENVNYMFTSIFLAEFLIKIIALGPQLYLDSNWNKLDFFIVISSFIEIILNFAFNTAQSFLRIGPQIVRIFRVLRITRIFKLIKRLKGLRKLIETLIVILPSILNLGSLYLLVFFIYAIVGVYLYKDVIEGKTIDEYNNFHNVFSAGITLFRMVTGENWWGFMFDCFHLPPNCVPDKTCGNGFFLFINHIN